MLLKKLIKNCPKNLFHVKVKGLSSDTRKLKKGDLFFALKGSKYNGDKFIKKALLLERNMNKKKIVKYFNIKERLVFQHDLLY